MITRFQTIWAISALLILFSVPASAYDLTERIDIAAIFLQTGKPDSAAVLLYDIVDGMQNKNEQVRALYFLALAVGQLGRRDEKMQYLERASDISPLAPFADKVRYAYTQLLMEAGNVNGAVVISQDFVKTYPKSPLMPDMLFMLGQAFFSKGESLKACNFFSEISKSYKNSYVAHEAVLKEGICLFKLNLVTGAIDRFEKYIADNPQGGSIDEALYYLGLSYERTGRTDLAVNVFKKLTLNYPSYPRFMEIFYRLGKNLYETGKYGEAENAFLNYLDNSRKSDIYYDNALFYLERIAYKKGDYSSETEFAENFVSKYPSNRLSPKLLLELAWYYRLSDKPDKAIEKYQTIINGQLRPDFSDSAIFYQADTYVSIDRKDAAVEFLKEIAHRKMHSAWAQAAFYKLSMLHEEWMEPDEAIAWYDSAASVGISPDLTVKSLMGMARNYREINRWLDASKVYEKILDDYPKTPFRADVYISLAHVNYLIGKQSEAARNAREGLQFAQGKKKTDILFFLAGVYEELDNDRALQLYWNIYESPGNSSEQRNDALMKIGEIAMKKGDRKSAANVFSKILSGDADSLFVDKARKKLNAIQETPQGTDSSRPQ
jgi:TolA-binding protein